MKIFIALLSLCCTAALLAAPAPSTKLPLTGVNAGFLVKLTSSIDAATSKVGDPVTGVVILPVAMRGGRVVGTVDRADHAILQFSFHTLTFRGDTWKMQSQLSGVVSSKGNMGQDDLGQRIRLDGGGVIAYGTTTVIDEGAEIRFVAWEP